jgi:hypothetical protein
MTESSVVREAGVATALPSRYLRRSDAARYVTDNWFPCSPKTLAKLACVGGSPPMRHVGRIPLYSPGDLDEWAQRKIGPVVNSTSELRQHAA